MLTVGTKAPDFTLPDQNGIMHSLSEYSGKKVLLYFYPKDNTSGCSKQAASYSEKIAEFDKKNVTVVESVRIRLPLTKSLNRIMI